MSEPTPIDTLRGLVDEIGHQVYRVKADTSPIVAQYQLACIRDLVSEMYVLSNRLAKQLADDASKLTKKEDTNG